MYVMCIFVCMHFVCEFACVRVWEQHWAFIFVFFPVWDKVSFLLCPPGTMVHELLEIIQSLPPVSSWKHWDYRGSYYLSDLHVGSVALNSGPHSNVANAFTHGAIVLVPRRFRLSSVNNLVWDIDLELRILLPHPLLHLSTGICYHRKHPMHLMYLYENAYMKPSTNLNIFLNKIRIWYKQMVSSF